MIGLQSSVPLLYAEIKLIQVFQINGSDRALIVAERLINKDDGNGMVCVMVRVKWGEQLKWSKFGYLVAKIRKKHLNIFSNLKLLLD